MITTLLNKIKETKAPVCVGLDPMLAYIPDEVKKAAFAEKGENLEGAAEACWRFNEAILKATADLIPAVKPQIAMYEQFGIPGLIAYEKTVRFAKKLGLIVIADVKRGDIGSTSAAYAEGHLGSITIGEKQFFPFDADMATVNPYLGSDGVKPFLEVCGRCDKGIFVLVKTSNPSSGELQDRLIDGEPLYARVADLTSSWGASLMEGEWSNVGAVVGATYPKMLSELRARMPHIFFLIPGYGAQGGKAEDLAVAFNEKGEGGIVNSSRGIIAAWKQEQYRAFGAEGFAKAARQATLDMIADLRRCIRFA